MTKKQRKELLYLILFKMSRDDSKERRYTFQVIGEGLIGEYLDMDYDKTKKQIEQEEQ